MDKYINSMMGTAELFSKQSYCRKKQVGAVLARDGRILATGYNGTISGQKNECEDITFVCPYCGNTGKNVDDILETNITKSAEYGDMVQTEYCKQCHKKLAEVGLPNKLSRSPRIVKQLEPTFKTSEFTVHAEQNIITYCAKNGISTDGTTMYITMSPCKQCAKLIAQAGIIEVVYKDNYKDMSGVEFLNKINIKTTKYEPQPYK